VTGVGRAEKNAKHKAEEAATGTHKVKTAHWHGVYWQDNEEKQSIKSDKIYLLNVTGRQSVPHSK